MWRCRTVFISLRCCQGIQTRALKVTSLLVRQKRLSSVHLTSLLHYAENEAYWDEDGNIVCSGREEDFQLLSEKNQKLFLLQELLASLGLEA